MKLSIPGLSALNRRQASEVLGQVLLQMHEGSVGAVTGGQIGGLTWSIESDTPSPAILSPVMHLERLDDVEALFTNDNGTSLTITREAWDRADRPGVLVASVYRG